MQRPQAASFAAQYDALLDAYYTADARVVTAGNSDDDAADDGAAAAVSVGRTQRMLELQAEMAQLSAAHGDARLALSHHEKVLAWLDTHELTRGGEAEKRAESEEPGAAGPPLDPEEEENGDDDVPASLRAVLPELRINTLANMATLHFRVGDAKTALALLLRAKTAMRELKETAKAADELAAPQERHEALRRLEMAVTANYSMVLHTQGAVDDAVAAAETVLDLAGPMPKKGKKTALAATVDAAVEQARLAATGVLVSASRSTGDAAMTHKLSSQLQHSLELAKDADAVLLARSHSNVGIDCFESRDFARALSHFLSAFRLTLDGPTGKDSELLATLRYHVALTLAQLGTSVVLPGEDQPVDASECLARPKAADDDEEDDAVPDRSKRAVVVQACRGELSLFAGSLETATNKFSAALSTLKGAIEQPPTMPSTEVLSTQELVKIQGFVESYLGLSLLLEGKFQAAEEAHQRDLELALESEDIHAQLRALRNLALVYNATQRFHEAITLWRETLEIAAVLDSKRDLLMGYGGLGAALHALSIVDYASGEYVKLLQEPANEPRAVFLRQRALAAELGELDQQVAAQKSVVATYEWRQRGDELEQRLHECDEFVRLCELKGASSSRADAYRSLANALTVQIARLAERGQRFAEAIRVLKFKRNVYLQKFRDAAMPPTSGRNKPPADPTPVRQPHARVELLLQR